MYVNHTRKGHGASQTAMGSVWFTSIQFPSGIKLFVLTLKQSWGGCGESLMDNTDEEGAGIKALLKNVFGL